MTFNPAFSRSLQRRLESFSRNIKRPSYPCRSKTLIVGSVRNFFAAFVFLVFWSIRKQVTPEKICQMTERRQTT